jgi:hypothetical protein
MISDEQIYELTESIKAVDKKMAAVMEAAMQSNNSKKAEEWRKARSVLRQQFPTLLDDLNDE